MPPNEQSPTATTQWHLPLPWVIGSLAFLVYCLTLNHWASLSSIGAIARVSDWTWQPELRQPLTCALLYPFRLLPVAWLPFALNLFTVICAALVLTLLARSVTLLLGAVGSPSWACLSRPSNSDEVGRGVPTAPRFIIWVPVTISAAVCSLQLSFWEHATAFSGEMLDLLIFAYVIRCLLEYRSRNADIPVGKFQNDQRENMSSKTQEHDATELAKPHPRPIRWGEGSRERGSVHGQENTDSNTEQHKATELAKPHPRPIRGGEGSRVRGSVHSQSWLFRSAFIYSAGMANNWAMIGYFPLYIVAVLFVKNFGFKRTTKPPPPRQPRRLPRWLRDLLAKIGIRQNAMAKPVYAPFRPVVFDTNFFLRMALWGLAGLSFYLLLPAIQSLSSHSTLGFWPALKANLSFQKNLLGVLRSPTFRLLAIASLLPALVLVLGWRSKSPQSGYETRRAIFLNRLFSYPLHGLIFLLALWLSFDPTFSPRHLSLSIPMLSYYYLSAIVAGYCAGYFLQVAKEDPPKPFPRLVPVTICALAAILPLLLISKNLRQIRLTNGPSLHQLARETYADLPDGKSIVLGNDFAQLSLLRAELAAQGQAKDALVVELPSLSSAQYHVFMARQFGARWPVIPPTNGVDLVGPIKLLKLISAFAEHEPVVYLDPNFGPLFDRPADSLTGFIHHFATVGRAPSLPSASDVGGSPRADESHSSSAGGASVHASRANDSPWQQRWTNHIQDLAAYFKPYGSPQRLRRLQTEPNATAFFLGATYSKSLNNWGVQLQRTGQWAEAAEWFRRSLALNPQNVCAHINLEFNTQWQQYAKANGSERTNDSGQANESRKIIEGLPSPHPMGRGIKGEGSVRLNPATIQKQYADIFARHNDWRDVLSDFGSVDEPTFLFRTGRAFLANGNPRLAANAFQRSSELAPDWPQPILWLSQSFLAQGNFAQALETLEPVSGIGASASSLAPSWDGKDLAQLLHCRATSLRGLGRTNEIGPCIDAFIRDYDKHHEVLAAAADAYAQNGMHEQQLATIEELLKREPNRSEWLSQKGLAELQLARYDSAITTLTIALSLAPSDDNARLSRAAARIGAEQLDAAREDYQQLLKSKTCSANALFGLGTIAWRRQDTNSAIDFYQQYLTNAAPGSPQLTVANRRLKELKPR